MDLFDAIETRASVRSFAPTTITTAELAKTVDAGRRAPSGYNRQPCEFVIVTDPAVIGELGSIQACIGEAAAAIAIVVDEAATDYWKEDASAAIENMLLALVALGYASVWVEGYVLRMEAEAKEILAVPDNLRLLAILPIGKPAGTAAQKEKKPLADIAYANRYGVPADLSS